MTSKAYTVAALDIGTHLTKVIISEESADGDLSVIGVGSAPSRGLRKGVVINIDNTVSSIDQALKQAESMAGVEVDGVYCSISGSHILGANSNGIVAVKGKEVSLNDIDRVIEAAKAVAIPMDRELLHILPQQFIVDGQDGIKEPVGINGVRLESRVHLITGAVASAENIVKCANRCGLTVYDIVFSGIAAGRSVTTVEEQELGVCVIDIGAGTSDIVVFHGGAAILSHVIPLGGLHVSNDIAAGLRTPIHAAENIKSESGVALSCLVGTDETLEVPSTGDRESRVISKFLLSEIIEARLTEIFQLIQSELIEQGADTKLISGIVLTGGVSSQKRILELAESIFGIPVRKGVPRKAKGLSDLINDPAFSTAYGLISYGAMTKSAARSAPKFGFFKEISKKVANWFGDHF